MSLFLASVLLVAVVTAEAAPLPGYGGSASASFSPLAAALSILPLPLLAALKFTYVRFRRGQSIHAHPHTANPAMDTLSQSGSSLVESASSGQQHVLPGFWLKMTPYLVGFLGSPEWETTIRSRLDKTLRQAKIESRRSSRRSLRSTPCSPAFVDTSRTTGNTSTSYYSSLSHKSRSRSRSKSVSASFGDLSSEKLPSPRFNSHPFTAITDCTLLHPSSPPCQHHDVFLPALPPPAHTLKTPVRISVQGHSPTLMQIMEPVLASWYDDSKGKQVQYDSSESTVNVSRDKSGSSADSASLPFQTPLTSPPTPGMPGAFSVSSMPFSLLRKQLGVSVTPSALSLSATTFSSPTAVSLAVFHSPVAPSLPVPKPIYYPDSRPESCAVLPSDWQADCDYERLGIHALLHSPTHRSPAPGRPSGIFDVLNSPIAPPARSPKVTFSPVLAPPASPGLQGSTPGSAPVVLKSALKKGASASPALPSSLRNSVSFSLLSVEAPGVDLSASLLSVSSAMDGDSSKYAKRNSWSLADLVRNGQLDVDAVLGLGLGLGSRSSVGSVGSAPSVTLTVPAPTSPVAAVGNDSDADVEYDVEQYASGWGSPELAPDGTADEGTVQMRWHVHGLQLSAIPEETRSEVCSVAGSVHVVGEGEEDDVEEAVQDSGVVSMELDSELMSETMRKEEAEVQALVNDPRHESWREGESVVTLSVGIAW
ncbi:hypothetical protein C8Q77DRAFT_1216683 [Trametes polyzona]|nr:hypothetical protein C8Q77DRAFT_1216683 [Trametes polyzona]